MLNHDFVINLYRPFNFILLNPLPMRVSLKTRSIVVEIICLLFILLFVYAAVSKLMDVEDFAGQIGQSPLLSPYMWIIAWAIPLIEIIVAVAISLPAFRLYGLFGAFGLMVMFTAYIISILQFSADIPCSCGGVLQSLGWQ